MFDFLKKKLKESVDSLKKVFKPSLSSEENLEGKNPVKEIEPISEAETKVMEEIKEEVQDEVKEEEKKEEKEHVLGEIKEIEAKAEAVNESVKEAEKKQILKEVKEIEPISEAETKVMEEIKEEVQDEVKEEEKKEEKEHVLGEIKEIEAKAEAVNESVKEAEKKQILKEVKEIEVKAEDVEKVIEQNTGTEKKPEKKVGFFGRIFGKKAKKEEKKKEEPKKEEIQEAPKEEPKPEIEEKPKEEKKGIFSALFEKTLTEEDFETFFANLEMSLLEANLAYEVTQLLKKKLKDEMVGKKIARGKGEDIIFKTIENTFREILYEKSPDSILKVINENKAKGEPTKFMFLGVNGVGKTTTLAKMCQWLKDKGYSVVFSASDTFRAASIEQLEKHASRLGVNVIKHKYGGDPAAVAFDAIEHAKSKKIDVVLIDSAGRQHTSANLMDELKKLKRVAKPDFSIFVADAMTGNDAVEQAREFGEQIGFDFSILGKADVDQKGGAILSVSYVSGKPIAFLGMGQEYKDLEPFDKEKLLKRIF